MVRWLDLQAPAIRLISQPRLSNPLHTWLCRSISYPHGQCTWGAKVRLLGLVYWDNGGQWAANTQLVSEQEAPTSRICWTDGLRHLGIYHPCRINTRIKSKNPTMLQVNSTLATSVAGSILTPPVKELSAIFIKINLPKKPWFYQPGFICSKSRAISYFASFFSNRQQYLRHFQSDQHPHLKFQSQTRTKVGMNSLSQA